MKAESSEGHLKLFNLSFQYLGNELRAIEQQYSVSILQERETVETGDPQYYRQFDNDIRSEAAGMGLHYEVFYCLERSMRKLIAETIESVDGPNWWDANHIPETVMTNVESNIKRERDYGFSIRSDAKIDYTNFGELGEIIKKNWTIFGSIFNSQRAVEKVISSLNMLRNNIAHCCPLSEDEVVRLRLSVKDWFRLME